ncbi:hypothetical protein [Enterobacter cancerogenus]|uniref:hypothetical protein n=1 Tax=Enterobacter cancerogenus TaxID=69218 RepID=UPI001C7D2D3C|nr:hypothetical protein [Enterobacter cancerogenus]
MFTLYMKWDAKCELKLDDIQFILSPDEAMIMASIFYELDYLAYPFRVIPNDVPERKKGVHHRFGAHPYLRKHPTQYDALFDNVKWQLEFGWMIGVDTTEPWDHIRHPFSFDERGELIYDCFMDHYSEMFEREVRDIHAFILNEHHGRKPAPTIKKHYTDAPAQPTKTINSKAAGRLLAAGGIYNGNIEGFQQTAEQLGGDAAVGYKQIMSDQTKGLLIAGASIAAGITMGRVGGSELEKLEAFGAKGTYTSRPFDPEKAGGPVEYLTTEGTNITYDGIHIIEKHISRFDTDPGNDFMIARLKKIANNEILPEQVDLNFYTHECREYQRYCNLGWETGRPADNIEAYELWNNTHTATLEDYRITGDQLYHPDAPLW